MARREVIQLPRTGSPTLCLENNVIVIICCEQITWCLFVVLFLSSLVAFLSQTKSSETLLLRTPR